MGTVFFGPFIDQDPVATEALASQVFPVGGSLSNLNVRLTGAAGAGSDAYTFVLRANGGTNANAQTCTVTTTQSSCADGTGSLPVAAGQLVSLQATETDSPLTVQMHWTAQFTSTP